jgi:peptidoglycan-associated lipoprotein
MSPPNPEISVNTTKTLILLSCVTAALLSACSSTPVATPVVAQPTKVAPAPVVPTPAAPAPAPVSKVASVTIPAYLDPNNAISKERSVYFDFDDFSIKKDFSQLVERQGKYLASNSTVAIKIEGNADERGSSEYNLALGQKRAQAVLASLKVYGVKDSQMEAVSWGKEKPKAKGHAEADWAENRRADIEYPKK